jgi:hypothetical protein
MRRFAQLALASAALGALILAVRQHADLPARVATHFGADGQPNGWMARDSHTTTQIAITLFVAGLFAALPLALPRVPDRFINLPHRDYWLAPKRRAASLAWLASMLYCLGTALQVFLAFIYREVARANLVATPAVRLNSLWLQVSLFIVIVTLVITLLFRFRRPDGARE